MTISTKSLITTASNAVTGTSETFPAVSLSGGTSSSGGGSSGVTSVNSLTGAVTLAAGSNITLTPSGNTITIASSGGSGGHAGKDAVSSVYAYASGVTSLSGGGWTKVAFAAESYDNLGEYDTTSSEFQPDADGIYLIIGRVYANAQSSGNRRHSVAIYKNGSIYAQGDQRSGSANIATVSEAVCIAKLTTSDVITIYSYIDQTQDTVADANRANFQVIRID